VSRGEIPAQLTGAHTLEITMNGRWPSGRINLVGNEYAPSSPRAVLRGDSLAWPAVDGARSYVVVRNGVRGTPTPRTAVRVERGAEVTEYQVLARDASGVESFLSEPIRVVARDGELTAAPTGALEREHAGYSGAGYLTLAIDRNQRVELPLTIARAGAYVLDVRYANGNGPINTDSKAAVRTLLVDDVETGAIVLPQRGQNAWSEWGYSNGIRVRLSAGEHRVTLRYDPWDANMNRHVNTALLDHLRVTRVGR
jgi:hypothetical protein